MKTNKILDYLIYLDRDYITSAYEVITGKAPATQITKNESIRAGVQIPFFSGGSSAGESRSFSVSTLGMLKEIIPELKKAEELEPSVIQIGQASKTGWVTGDLSIFRVVLRKPGKSNDQLDTSETYFGIHTQSGLKLALITTPEYFSSGLDAFTKLYDTVLSQTKIPVEAMVRVYASHSSFGEWIAVPLVIFEIE